MEAQDAQAVNSTREEGEGGGGVGDGWLDGERQEGGQSGPRAVFKEALRGGPDTVDPPSSPWCACEPQGHSLQP